MPLYEYKCLKTGELAEVYLPLRDYNKRFIYCPLHTNKNNNGEEINWHDAEKVWSLPANIQSGKPTIAFINPKTGEARVAINQYEKPPKGFAKEELKGPIERSRFEQTQNAINAEKDNEYNTKQEVEREIVRTMQHDQVKAEASSIAAQSNNPHVTEQLLKDYLKRSKKQLKKRKTEFRLDVNHLDKSNL